MKRIILYLLMLGSVVLNAQESKHVDTTFYKIDTLEFPSHISIEFANDTSLSIGNSSGTYIQRELSIQDTVDAIVQLVYWHSKEIEWRFVKAVRQGKKVWAFKCIEDDCAYRLVDFWDDIKFYALLTFNENLEWFEINKDIIIDYKLKPKDKK